MCSNLPAPPQRPPDVVRVVARVAVDRDGCIGCGGEDVDRVGARAGVERHPLPRWSS